jgi:spore maturation protein CgeB
MVNGTILLLTPYEDLSQHQMVKWLGYLKMSVRFDECFYQPLCRIFPKVILYDYLKRMVDTGINAMNQEIIDLVKKERPRYVLWVAFGEYYEITIPSFDKIREEGSKVVAWFFDDEVRFDFYSKWWIPYVDYFMTNDGEAVAKYRELGAWATLAVPDTGEPTLSSWSDAKYKYEVSFVGTLRADREEYLAFLHEKNVQTSFFGMSFGNFVTYPEMSDIFHTSKVNLNFSRTYARMKFGLKGRIFQVCLAGGFLLTEYLPGLEKYFEIGKEIDCFRDKEEMVEKIRYYLGHDAERQAIARAGWERACSQHAASHVIAKAFAEIEQAKPVSQTRNQTELAMPEAVQKRVAKYYGLVGIAFLRENYRGLWQDAFRLSMSYHSSTRVRLYASIGSLPLWLRIPLVKVEGAWVILHLKLLIALGRVPYLRRAKRFVFSKLFHGDG